MTIAFNLTFCIKMIVAFIMTFALGMKFDVPEETRAIAKYVWGITLILLWTLNIIFPTK